MSENTHLVQGDGLVPHDSNPKSATQDATEAMEKAQKAADEAAEADAKAAQDADETPGESATSQSPAPGSQEGSPASGDDPDSQVAEGDALEVGDLQPLESWNAGQQDVFRGLDKDTQQFMLDVADASRREMSSQLEALQGYQQFADQWGPYFKQLGAPAPQLLNSLMQTEMMLRTGTPQQKQAALGQIMQTYGLGTDQQQAPALPDNVASDPVAQAMNDRLNQVMQAVQGLEGRMTNQFGQFQQAQQQSGEAQLATFRDATDDKGNLLRPYFNQVRPLMESIAENAASNGQQLNLEQCYEMACRADPDVFAKQQSAAKAADLIGRQKAAKAKQAAAKSVSSSPGGSRTVTNPDDGKANESVLETVQRAMAAHSGTA